MSPTPHCGPLGSLSLTLPVPVSLSLTRLSLWAVSLHLLSLRMLLWWCLLGCCDFPQHTNTQHDRLSCQTAMMTSTLSVSSGNFFSPCLHFWSFIDVFLLLLLRYLVHFFELFFLMLHVTSTNEREWKFIELQFSLHEYYCADGTPVCVWVRVWRSSHKGWTCYSPIGFPEIDIRDDFYQQVRLHKSILKHHASPLKCIESF